MLEIAGRSYHILIAGDFIKYVGIRSIQLIDMINYVNTVYLINSIMNKQYFIESTAKQWILAST